MWLFDRMRLQHDFWSCVICGLLHPYMWVGWAAVRAGRELCCISEHKRMNPAGKGCSRSFCDVTRMWRCGDVASMYCCARRDVSHLSIKIILNKRDAGCHQIHNTLHSYCHIWAFSCLVARFVPLSWGHCCSSRARFDKDFSFSLFLSRCALRSSGDLGMEEYIILPV